MLSRLIDDHDPSTSIDCPISPDLGTDTTADEVPTAVSSRIVIELTVPVAADLDAALDSIGALAVSLGIALDVEDLTDDDAHEWPTPVAGVLSVSASGRSAGMSGAYLSVRQVALTWMSLAMAMSTTARQAASRAVSATVVLGSTSRLSVSSSAIVSASPMTSARSS